MSRHGYSDDCDDQWALIRWRGAVASAIRGRRGQAFLRELLTALDALPEKRLIARELVQDGQVCAIGSVALLRGLDVSALDPEDPDAIAAAFGISAKLVQEIEYENDEYGRRGPDENAGRFERVRKWVVQQIKPEAAA